MRVKIKKKIAICLIIIFILSASSPLVSSLNKNILEYSSNGDFDEEELVLLRGEHYLYLDASENTSSFNIRYSFPPEYDSQIPIFLEILDDTTANLINYKIENDANEPNKIINFTIGSIKKDQRDLLHFNFWVLVRNHNYSDLSDHVDFPTKENLPDETHKWLLPSEVVQSDSFRIKFKAKQLKLFTNNLLKYAERTAKFTKWHRYLLFFIQYKLSLYGPQDALTTLSRNGECPGRSHLGCALFRANNIPARVILAMPSYSFWFEMHYMTEYYCPEYGWILTEVHKGETPFEPKKQIILRICYPEDENNTQTDFLYPKMKGLERWFWIDNENVTPYYSLNEFTDWSKSRGFNEKEIIVNSVDADQAFLLTKSVYDKFEHYLGMDLTGENLGYFQNATDYQKQAINKFIKLNDPDGYLYRMTKALDEYNQICI